MFFIRKNFVLHRQVNPCTIYQVYNRQMIFHSNLLHAQILFAAYREPCTCLHRLIVSYYYTLPSAYITYAAYRTAGRTSTLFNIHVKTCKSTNFYKWLISITKVFYPFPCGKLVALPLFFNSFFTTTFIYFFKQLPYLAPGKYHGIFIFVFINIHTANYAVKVIITKGTARHGQGKRFKIKKL